MKRLYCIILSLILFSFSYGDNEYTAYIKRVNSIGTFIGDTAQAVNYDFDICIEPRNNENAQKNPYFIPESPIENDKITMTLDNIVVIEGKGANRNFYFPVNKYNKLDTLKLRVTGKITLKAPIENLNGSGRIKLGEVRENNENQRKEVWLTFDYGILKKEDTVSLRVVRDMDLGVAVAGYPLRSSKPAIVEIKGIKGREVEVRVTKSVSIENKAKNSSLNVMLDVENYKARQINNESAIELKPTNDSVEIKINGYSKTEKNTPSGVYEGAFKVRVIY
ncbi:MAG: hypothetical protein Q4P79_02545 [Fusobacterium sp.]|nr:DUF4402 domain-containing protein [Fusobacterium sp.]MDO5788318.1 hypothetical protein [Fusobacterium sp.]